MGDAAGRELLKSLKSNADIWKVRRRRRLGKRGDEEGALCGGGSAVRSASRLVAGASLSQVTIYNNELSNELNKLLSIETLESLLDQDGKVLRRLVLQASTLRRMLLPPTVFPATERST